MNNSSEGRQPYPSPAQLDTIYAARAAQLATLARAGRISLADVRSLDRIGRFSVACDYWALCEQAARKALLTDSHPHVRSAAALSLKAHAAPSSRLDPSSDPTLAM